MELAKHIAVACGDSARARRCAAERGCICYHLTAPPSGCPSLDVDGVRSGSHAEMFAIHVINYLPTRAPSDAEPYYPV
jgi:hypothetical protein